MVKKSFRMTRYLCTKWGISMKLATNIHRVNGGIAAEKDFQGLRSKTKIMTIMYYSGRGI